MAPKFTFSSGILTIVTVVLLLQLHIQLCKSQFNAIAVLRPDPYKKWSHQVTLGAGMSVKWDAEDRDYVTMEMSAPTRGYLGIGFSPSGGMAGADIILGWIDSRGRPFVMDCHAFSEGAPIEDLQQDITLLTAEELDNRTTIGFRRRWDTCDDKYDMAIGSDTIRMIWAYYSEDPVLRPFLQHHYHGPTRGVQSVFMRTRFSTMRFPDDQFTGDRSVQNWDVGMRNVRINGIRASRFCKVIKFPRPDKKHHMIGYRPQITPGNGENVRQISIYVCQLPPGYGDARRTFEPFLQSPEQECFPQYVPGSWQQYCSTLLFTWGIGSEGEMLPSHVGIPLGLSSEEGTYFKLEVLYENVDVRPFSDSSGLRIFYTENLRRYDASTLFLGHRVTPFQMIPQSQENFMTYSFCSKECTQQGIPSPTGLKVISVLLYGHVAARNIRLRHIRKGKELSLIAEDNKYDFKYQQFRQLSNEVNVLPGDELIVECNYDTSGRNTMTFGGFSPDEEICQAIALYYPRTNLTDCRSQPEFYSFFNAFGINNVTGELLTKFDLPYGGPRPPQRNFLGEAELLPPDNAFQMVGGVGYGNQENPFDFLQITNPFHPNGMSVGEYLRRMNWKDEKLVQRLQESWRNGFHYMFCGQAGQRILIQNQMMQFPEFEKFQDYGRSECRPRPPRSTGSPELKIFRAAYTCSIALTLLFSLVLSY